ncbi:MAG: FkbM family methyltransferase [Methylocystis sp.]|uniref:FkbM family methyltransferase n=1 Tax=Methylocystis sp. TaxID=1911079 RepID=UPI003DA51A7D
MKSFQKDAMRRISWRLGRKVYAKARGEPLSAQISSNGEASLQQRVLAAIPPSTPMQVLDVGANRGEWTLSLLRQASPARLADGGIQVDAFEPVPMTADRFERELRTAPEGARVRLHRYGLSDTPGCADMALTSITGGTNTLHFDPRAGQPSEGWCKVRLETLTRFCEETGIKHVHFVKCDAEGHDMKVIAGARPLLEAGRIDVLQFEYNHRWVHGRAFLKDAFDLISGLPYRLAKVRSHGRIDIYESWHPELERYFEANYLLVREPALSWFDGYCGSFDESNSYA